MAATLILASACSKSVEGETKRWQSNTKTVSALMAQYPGMKPALEARMSSAKTTFDAASNASGDAQIQQMAAANSALMAGFVGDLGDVADELKELRKASVEAAAMAGDESSRLAAKIASEDAQKTITRSEEALQTGAADEAAAEAVIAKVSADIETARSAVDEVLEADEKKGEAKTAEKEAAAAAAAAEKADAEAKVAPWTCEYCDTENKHDATSCVSCGAPKSEAKPK